MERVMHGSVLPIMADESCVVEDDVERCALHFNGINIKLTKCGGLTPALRMLKRAQELGLKTMAIVSAGLTPGKNFNIPNHKYNTPIQAKSIFFFDTLSLRVMTICFTKFNFYWLNYTSLKAKSMIYIIFFQFLCP